MIHLVVWPQQTWAEKRHGLLCPFRREELSPLPNPHLTQCGLSRGIPTYQVASWSIHPFGHNRHGPQISGGLLCSLFLRQGAGSPSNTMWHGEAYFHTKRHPNPSTRLFTIHRRHGQTDSSDSIGRTAFSERKLTFTFAICYRPSVSRLSVCRL